MATTKVQKEMTGAVQSFIGLWNRYYTLYLENVQKHDITGEKENEFLKFQGTVVEELVPILELDEKSRFDIHDRVMTVVNEIVSLDSLMRMSEFQINRTKHQWQEAMEELEKLYRFCDIYDSKIDKVQRIAEVKKKNPYWDPTAGGLREVLSRIAVAPVTFFQGLKAGIITGGIGSFLFLTFFIPVIVISTIVFMVNFGIVKSISKNIVVEAGLLSSDESGFIPNIIIAFAIIVGLAIIALALTLVLIVLHHIFTWFLHLGFKLTGAKEPYNETYKAVTYATAPFVAAVTAPYAFVLQIIGASKVHRYPYVLAGIGWLIGAILYLLLIFAVLGATFFAAGVVPPMGAKYALVNTREAPLFYGLEKEEESSAIRGTYLLLSDAKGEPKTLVVGRKANRQKKEVLEVKYEDKTYYVEADNVKIVEFSATKMPRFIIDKSSYYIGKGQKFITEKIEEYSK
jgi:hypothetical protein